MHEKGLSANILQFNGSNNVMKTKGGTHTHTSGIAYVSLTNFSFICTFSHLVRLHICVFDLQDREFIHIRVINTSSSWDEWMLIIYTHKVTIDLHTFVLYCNWKLSRIYAVSINPFLFVFYLICFWKRVNKGHSFCRLFVAICWSVFHVARYNGSIQLNFIAFDFRYDQCY